MEIRKINALAVLCYSVESYLGLGTNCIMLCYILFSWWLLSRINLFRQLKSTKILWTEVDLDFFLSNFTTFHFHLRSNLKQQTKKGRLKFGDTNNTLFSFNSPKLRHQGRTHLQYRSFSLPVIFPNGSF